MRQEDANVTSMTVAERLLYMTFEHSLLSDTPSMPLPTIEQAIHLAAKKCGVEYERVERLVFSRRQEG